MKRFAGVIALTVLALLSACATPTPVDNSWLSITETLGVGETKVVPEYAMKIENEGTIILYGTREGAEIKLTIPHKCQNLWGLREYLEEAKGRRVEVSLFENYVMFQNQSLPRTRNWGCNWVELVVPPTPTASPKPTETSGPTKITVDPNSMSLDGEKLRLEIGYEGKNGNVVVAYDTSGCNTATLDAIMEKGIEYEKIEITSNDGVLVGIRGFDGLGNTSDRDHFLCSKPPIPDPTPTETPRTPVANPNPFGKEAEFGTYRALEADYGGPFIDVAELGDGRIAVLIQGRIQRCDGSPKVCEDMMGDTTLFFYPQNTNCNLTALGALDLTAVEIQWGRIDGTKTIELIPANGSKEVRCPMF